MEKKARIQFWMEFAVDAISLLIAYTLTVIFLNATTQKVDGMTIEQWLISYALMALSFLSSYAFFHSQIDIHTRNRFSELISTIKNGALTYLFFIVLAVFTRSPIMEKRVFLLFSFLIFTALALIGRYYLKRWLTHSYNGKNKRIASYVGVLTTKDRAEEFVSFLKEDWCFNVSGVALLDNFVDEGRFIYDPELDYASDSVNSKTKISTKKKIKFPHVVADDIPVIATDIRFIDWIRSAPLDEVFINLPYERSTDVSQIVEELESMGVTVHLNVPTLDNMLNKSIFNNISCKIYAGYPIATFAAAVHNSGALIVKRVFDFTGALIGIILSAPVIAIVAIPLLIESPGPLFFKQERVGKNGRIFKIYKLRSMYKDAEKRKKELMSHNKMDGLMFKMDNDPRITKVGRVIRKLSIDELPQFINVLKGDMSLVGTRPPTVKEFEKYENRHKRRLSMRPGITGMWQVSGRSNINDFEEVVKLDCEYIDNWSIWLDLRILLRTVKVVLTHEGAE